MAGKRPAITHQLGRGCVSMRAALTALLLVIALPRSAHAQDRPAEREYCPERPGLGNPACIISPGRVSVESAMVDWTRDDNADGRQDTILIGDTLVRVGLTPTIEAQIGWTPFGHVRMRDAASGTIDQANRIGDVLVGMKANLRSPDGSGFSAALQPFVTLPVGRSPVGAGTWGAGLIAPVTYDLSDTLNLELSPEVDAAVDQDGNGRHLAFGSVVGLGVSLTKALTATVEAQFMRDQDPSGATTQALGGLSFAWKVADDVQLDAGAIAGLNHVSPDVELYIGVSRRF